MESNNTKVNTTKSNNININTNINIIGKNKTIDTLPYNEKGEPYC